MNTQEPTHAGGVVFKTVDGEIRYLLVRANSARKEWVLPKGHIEKGESAGEAAIREVREESGVAVEIRGFLDYTSFVVEGEQVRVANYLMSAASEGQPGEARASRWCKFEDALALMTFEDSAQMLVRANEALTRAPRTDGAP